MAQFPELFLLTVSLQAVKKQVMKPLITLFCSFLVYVFVQLLCQSFSSHFCTLQQALESTKWSLREGKKKPKPQQQPNRKSSLLCTCKELIVLGLTGILLAL